ncbi:Ribulose-1,5 bisphosphate carboxylase/oxygenase large subunit N-methyltransferase, chloroplastic [Ananas comosus]|uniref:Ribulose-1,5 bisphosphate carboxylase/oxygenase large subunit N-methyltransferase, chloroplastic n=1 Tax=Ananas comosus TaxID=4615 RepID=A0A199VG45_ANACO|nr:Ribulose-1,5 bisphosphate carboxylase/oxygenase large subunit N-methyltransferase, chloroplastic [Ananas comosus]
MATPYSLFPSAQELGMATKKKWRGAEWLLITSILSEEDPLFPDKMRLSNVRNLSYNFDFPVSSSKSGMLKTLDQMVQTARLLYMHELELYFAEDDDFGPFSSRNELESLNSVLNTIHSVLATASGDAIELSPVLETATIGMIKSLGWRTKGLAAEMGEKVMELERTVASEDLSIGDVALEVPESLIISEDLVYGSDVFDVLKDLDDITSETMLLLWSMRERYNPSSKFRIYFETLPEEFNTGLRFAIDALAVLDGTLLFEELTQAKEHLRQQYDTLFPALSMKYPDLFKPELYTWEKYLWACELWYSNSMKVVLTDGKLKTCLIPIAGLLNHSVCQVNLELLC